MRPPKYLMGRNSFCFRMVNICECFNCFRGHTHYYTAIQSTTAAYLVVDILRSGHIVSIRTGLKSRLI